MTLWRSMAICTALWTPAALAAEPAALIVDVQGAVSPAVESFEDVDAGMVLTLAPDGEVIISHYKACEEITATGAGTISVSATGLELDGVTVSDRTAVDCPSAVALANADTASATVVIRDVMPLAKVPLVPEIVLVGDNAAKFEQLELRRRDAVIATLPVQNRRVQWPVDGLFLSDRTKYQLILTGPGVAANAEIVADKRTSARVVLRP